MDRTRVHILFFDPDPSTALETLSLLRKCFYQVTSVKSANQVLETVNSGQVEVDLILTEIGQSSEDKSCSMLKQILLQEKLSHIPVVVMSDCDEMAVVAKCLRLGAVDYLVKPLRLNEVLNLWTHMWRRRRMLGLPDKRELHGSLSLPLDSSITDTNESNNANTTCLEASAKGDQKVGKLALQAVDTSPYLELSLRLSSNFNAEKPLEQIPDASNPPVGPVLPPCSNGMELRIGQTSAFVTYMKQVNKPSSEQSVNVGSDSTAGDRYHDDSNDSEGKEHMDCRRGGPESRPIPNPVLYAQTLQPATFQMYNQHGAVLSINPGSLYSYYSLAPGVTPPSFVGYPSWPSGMMVAAVPAPITAPLPTPTSMTACNKKMTLAEKREAALNKFRQKRKGRCFEKKIRYASRKKLAEQRPRVRGQFVKRGHAVNSMIEIQADSAHDYMDEEEQEADDEQGFTNSSPDESMVGSSKLG